MIFIKFIVIFFYNIIIFYDFFFPSKEKLSFSENKCQIIQNDKFKLKDEKEVNER